MNNIEDLWEPLCKLMHQLAIRNGSKNIIISLNTHWIYKDICLVCNNKVYYDNSYSAYNHALQHAKEYNLLVLL